MREHLEMSNTSSKVIGITLCLFIGFYSASKLWKSDYPEPTSAHEGGVIEPLARPDKTDDRVKKGAEENAIRSNEDISAADVAAYKALSEDRGNISGEDAAIYQGYDLQTLESLAGNGDAHALNTLARRSVDAGEFDAAKEYYWRAAMVGSTTAIGHMALLAEPIGFVEMSDVERREKLIETMSLLKLAEIRGDIQAATVIGRGVKSNYESRFGALHFSDDESARINEAAQKMYENLKLRRSEMGLKDFDNSTPSVLNQMYKSK